MAIWNIYQTGRSHNKDSRLTFAYGKVNLLGFFSFIPFQFLSPPTECIGLNIVTTNVQSCKEVMVTLSKQVQYILYTACMEVCSEGKRIFGIYHCLLYPLWSLHSQQYIVK